MDKKVCCRCGVEKIKEEYSLDISRSDRLSSWCKLCRKEYSKKYRFDNKNKLVVCNIEWRKNNKLYVSEYNKKYREENRDIASAGRHRYNSKKKQLPSTLTVKQWNLCKEYFENRCAYCGEEKPLAQEHFIPISNGGGYTQDNIIPACQSCNSSKNNKKFDYWYHKQNYYSIVREQKIYDFFIYVKKENEKNVQEG